MHLVCLVLLTFYFELFGLSSLPPSLASSLPRFLPSFETVGCRHHLSQLWADSKTKRKRVLQGRNHRLVGVVQSLSRVQLFVTLWTAACQASLSFTVSRSLLRLMSIELMMPSNHLIFCWVSAGLLRSVPKNYHIRIPGNNEI